MHRRGAVIEREVKAVVPDPAAVAARLVAAGAERIYRGRMDDTRYDRAGEFTARDEVIRRRVYRGEGDPPREVLGWKGPVAVEAGTKLRREIEIEARGDVGGWLEAAGFEPVHRIDRYVEWYRLGAATVRLEWYPRMDVLVEIEGDHADIERAIDSSGIPRAAFSAESLIDFVARYEARGTKAILTVEALDRAPATWQAASE
ncbi:MAG: hypothetical protein FJ206_06715 [Gemmatimonadetes bacterium]|nr:hypothetical protein [Gemmatimonadota bacterium]